MGSENEYLKTTIRAYDPKKKQIVSNFNLRDNFGKKKFIKESQHFSLDKLFDNSYLNSDSSFLTLSGKLYKSANSNKFSPFLSLTSLDIKNKKIDLLQTLHPGKEIMEARFVQSYSNFLLFSTKANFHIVKITKYSSKIIHDIKFKSLDESVKDLTINGFLVIGTVILAWSTDKILSMLTFD